MNRMIRRAFALVGVLLLALSIAGSVSSQTTVHPIATLPINAATQLTGILPIANGGTGTSTGVPGSFVPPMGRLTLTTAVAVTTSDVTGASTVYYTSDRGGVVPISDGTTCNVIKFSEISIALSSLTSGANYDVFVKNVSGTATLELSAVWTNDTTRADAIARDTICSGLLVKSSAHTRTLLGTLRTTGTSTTEDSLAKRFVSNLPDASRPRDLLVTDATSSWTYATNTWRAARGQTSNAFEFVTMDARRVEADVMVDVQGGGVGFASGVGIDSTSANSAQRRGVAAGTGFYFPSLASYAGYPGLGYHKLTWLEIAYSGVTVTAYGAPDAAQAAGMAGRIWN